MLCTLLALPVAQSAHDDLVGRYTRVGDRDRVHDLNGNDLHLAFIRERAT